MQQKRKLNIFKFSLTLTGEIYFSFCFIKIVDHFSNIAAFIF